MKRSTNVIVSNLSRDNILFSTFYTGLFLLFRKKTGGAWAPPAPPLATALMCHNAFAKGLEVFGSSISEFVIDLHLWFKMSASRREDYEAVQEEMGLAKHKFLNM